MEHENISQPSLTESERILFTEKAISAGTMLGGPLVGAYLISENYKALNKNDDAKKTLIFGITVTLVFFPILLYVPEHIMDRIPEQVFHFFWAAVVYFIVKKYQGDSIIEHLVNGGKKGSGWIVFFSGLIGAVITFGYIIAFAFALTPYETVSHIPSDLLPLQIENTSGVLYYDTLNIKEPDAKVVGFFLTQLGYFNRESNNEAAYYKKDEIYYVGMGIPEFAWQNEGIQRGAKLLIQQLAASYPNHNYQVVLSSIDSTGEAKEFIIK